MAAADGDPAFAAQAVAGEDPMDAREGRFEPVGPIAPARSIRENLGLDSRWDSRQFHLGATLGTGVLLLGRTTWQLFSQIWPSRTDEFSAAMNSIPKFVASHTLTNLTAWPNSTTLDEDLIAFAERRKADRDVIVAGSASIVHALAAADLVDEYRILLFPSVLGTGIRLFPEGSAREHFRLVSAEPAGHAVLLCYERPVS